ncbi:MAG: hypothetical protein ACKVVP_03870 [Chloroflexota bacterium]
MSEPKGDAWSETVARAGAALEPLVRGALESLGAARWSTEDSHHWRVISYIEQATWELVRFVQMDTEGRYHYERIQVVATVSPSGALVTWQINNGSEFLGITDLTAYGLQRGALYLLDHEHREWVTSEPHFVHSGERSIIQALWLRIRSIVLPAPDR